MTVSAVLVYELHGATAAQDQALRRALALLPKFRDADGPSAFRRRHAQASSTSRTFRARSSGWIGFCKNAIPGARTPCWMIESSV
jgi:hypothetical protein